MLREASFVLDAMAWLLVGAQLADMTDTPDKLIETPVTINFIDH